MNLKKAKTVDLTRKSSLFLLLGLIFSLGFVISAFSIIKEPVKVEESLEIPVFNDVINEVVKTYKSELIQPKQKIVTKNYVPEVLKNIVEVDITEKKEHLKKKEVTTPEKRDSALMDLNLPSKTGTSVVDVLDKIIDEDLTESIKIENKRSVDFLPVHQKCKKYKGNRKKMSECLSKQISKDIFRNLPNDLEIKKKERVTVFFVIDEKGVFSQIKTNNKSELTREAIKAIKRLKPMQESAKVKGKSVPMRYAVPIIFQ